MIGASAACKAALAAIVFHMQIGYRDHLKACPGSDEAPAPVSRGVKSP
jgi:hypothetical protein